MSNEERLTTLTQKLQIPPNFLRIEHITDTAAISELERWKRDAASVLQDILHIIKTKQSLPVDTQSDVLFRTLPFASNHILDRDGIIQVSYGDEPWMSPDSRYAADEYKLKPIFKLSPHPNLHAETGRKVTNRPGGPLAVHDYYEEQKWKEYPGVEKIVLWCISGLQENVYETMWHLLIPPVMTLLDDFEARNKLHGVIIVRQMLSNVPKVLLRRTGVDGLLRQSLKTSLSHLQSPETPRLLKLAIETSVSLTLLTTSPSPGGKPSPDRFNELSSLLGEGIITGIWLYAEDKPDAVNATFEALPFLLKELGIGSIRFMKPLIPQLTHTLIPRPLVEPDTTMQLSAIKVLYTLLDVCEPRIEPWKETILNAIGRCWVGLMDQERGAPNTEVKKGLQMLCMKMAEICPSVTQNEFQKLLQADKELFEDLLPRHGRVAT
ncbi:hypothetical protein JR316_0008156 [Psilocybe cubensis]|uniref:Uncharacterized protein n=1 Tax=Psilocybe cubensis TaxID=181762 RepID=A0ACB8GWF9_PSICU|nr:hypothetical protein JR316_0008156 [Psilocybe cubensis]KAH9479561.1 hypothetical protein JR316_0008156 [Psilocybe cubensis]